MLQIIFFICEKSIIFTLAFNSFFFLRLYFVRHIINVCMYNPGGENKNCFVEISLKFFWYYPLTIKNKFFCYYANKVRLIFIIVVTKWEKNGTLITHHHHLHHHHHQFTPFFGNSFLLSITYLLIIKVTRQEI